MTHTASRLTGAVPADKIKSTDIPRHPDGFATRLLAIPDVSSAVADVLDQLDVGFAAGTDAARPLRPGSRCAGPAVTVRYQPSPLSVTQNRTQGTAVIFGDRDVYGLGQPGDIAVMDCAGDRAGAVMGALSARWAAKAGIGGVIVDGAVRDTASIIAGAVPVFSASRYPAAARYRYDLVELNGPVTVFGHRVQPGDYLVADDDGVCVIPFAHVARIVETCEAADRAERAFITRIEAATTLEHLVASLQPGSAPA
ncbi:MAG: RraA family protein [Mycobacterium sp.]|nr:RraA family protein [Mycobacterium sp.]